MGQLTYHASAATLRTWTYIHARGTWAPTDRLARTGVLRLSFLEHMHRLSSDCLRICTTYQWNKYTWSNLVCRDNKKHLITPPCFSYPQSSLLLLLHLNRSSSHIHPFSSFCHSVHLLLLLLLHSCPFLLTKLLLLFFFLILRKCVWFSLLLWFKVKWKNTFTTTSRGFLWSNLRCFNQFLKFYLSSC